MSLRKLPEVRADQRLTCAQFDMRPDALARWEPEIRAADDGGASTITIYDSIGDNWEGTGVTASRIGAALRSIGNRDVKVNVNSPGGDFFEGVAIYNLLRMHQAKVTVQVVGLAASAASVIAMAGDEILMGDGAFLMIHNAWAVAMGNRHDMKAAAETLEPFDAAMAALYADRAGISVEEAGALMDKETWIPASSAVEQGFATGLLDRGQASHQTNSSSARKAMALVEASMAKAGYSRSVRRDALKALFDGKPGATAEEAMPGAGNDVAASLRNLIHSLNG